VMPILVLQRDLYPKSRREFCISRGCPRSTRGEQLRSIVEPRQRPGACLTFDRRWRAQTTTVWSPREPLAKCKRQLAEESHVEVCRVGGGLWPRQAIATWHLAPSTHGNITPQGRDGALGRKSRKDCDLPLLAYYCPPVMNSSSPW
jgi:hypothetical protein